MNKYLIQFNTIQMVYDTTLYLNKWHTSYNIRFFNFFSWFCHLGDVFMSSWVTWLTSYRG